MKKFTKWLNDNGFIITSEYNKYTNTMRFEKGSLKFIIDPSYKRNVVLHSIYVRVNEYTKVLYENESKQICWESPTQKEMINKMIRYMKKLETKTE